jgi:hydroxymethylpyrimidine pyrophosphatase-like HAD family hydrolase
MPQACQNGPYRLLALDVDGTALNSAQQVTPELRGALARLAARSVRTVLCTGRRWRTAVPVLAQLGNVHPVVICSGGSLIKRADDERTLHALPLEHSTARAACRLFRREGLVPMLLYDRPLSGRELKVAAAERERAEQLPYVRANPGVWQWYRGDYPDGEERPLVLYAVDSCKRASGPLWAIQDGLGDVAIVEAMLQGRYGADQIAVEVHDPAATKWRALEWLLAQWEIDAGRVVAVGDDVNDIPMLEAVGLSFAMGNGSEEVKAAADAVTASNDEHGVVQALRSAFGP